MTYLGQPGYNVVHSIHYHARKYCATLVTLVISTEHLVSTGEISNTNTVAYNVDLRC